MNPVRRIDLISKQRLKELKQEGVYYGKSLFPPINSIREFLDKMMPEEGVVKLVEGTVEGKPGILGVTTARVVFVHAPKLSMEAMTRDITLQNITSVSLKSEMHLSAISMSVSGDVFEVKQISNSDAKEAVRAIRSPATYKSYTTDDLFPASQNWNEEILKQPYHHNSNGTGKPVLRYVGSVLILLVGISLLNSMSRDGALMGLAGFLLIITSISIAPFASRFINRKLKKQIAISSSLLAVTIIFTSVSIEMGNDEAKNQEANRSFSQVRRLLSANNIDDAVATAKKAKTLYSDTLENPAVEFLTDYNRFKSEKFISTTLSSISDEDYTNLKAGSLKRSFVKDSLLNKLFIQKLISGSDKRDELIQRKRIEAALDKKERERSERQAKIETQFSRYDGSHRNLEKAIKANMNDEDSYEHVETSYADEGDFLIVTTTFKGKNAFNATVKSTVVAKVSLDGEVLKFSTE